MSAKYEFIDAQKAHYPLVSMCAWAGVSTVRVLRVARPAGVGDRAPARRAAAAHRRDLRRLRRHLRLPAGAPPSWPAAASPAGPELVRPVMREPGLQPCQPRPFRPDTTIAGDAARCRTWSAGTSPRDAPGVKLVGDITYIRPGRAGRTWRPSSTATPRLASAGPWPTTCAPTWSCTALTMAADELPAR